MQRQGSDVLMRVGEVWVEGIGVVLKVGRGAYVLEGRRIY